MLLFHLLVSLPLGMWDLNFSSRDWTHTLCTGMQSLNHWPAREVPVTLLIFTFSKVCSTVSSCDSHNPEVSSIEVAVLFWTDRKQAHKLVTTRSSHSELEPRPAICTASFILCMTGALTVYWGRDSPPSAVITGVNIIHR